MIRLAAYMPAPTPPFVPSTPSSALPAKIEPIEGGGAWVTIGGIRSPYANAAFAREQLLAMEQRGLVQLDRQEALPC